MNVLLMFLQSGLTSASASGTNSSVSSLIARYLVQHISKSARQSRTVRTICTVLNIFTPVQFQNLAVWLFLRFCGPWCSPRTSDNAMTCDVIQASPRRESVRGCGFSQRDWIPFSNVTSLFSAPSHHNIDNISVKQYSLIS